MVGGSFDLELNYDIQDPFDILAMFELFERVSTKTKVSDLQNFILISTPYIPPNVSSTLQICTDCDFLYNFAYLYNHNSCHFKELFTTSNDVFIALFFSPCLLCFFGFSICCLVVSLVSNSGRPLCST